MTARFAPVGLGCARERGSTVAGLHVHEMWFAPESRLATHAHELPTLAISLDGSFDVDIARRSRDCRPCTVVVEPGAERHTNRIGGRGAHVLSLQVETPHRELVEPCAAFLDGVHIFADPGIGFLARRLTAELRRDEPLSDLFVEALALELLATAARLGGGQAHGRTPPPWLARARDLLEASLAHTPRASAIAAEVGVHPMHLTRAFRAHYGLSLGEAVRRRRLEWALERLAASDEPIATIAAQAGFADQSHLTRQLRRHTGLTPRRYREAMRGGGAAGEAEVS